MQMSSSTSSCENATPKEICERGGRAPTSAGCPTHRALCDEWLCGHPNSTLLNRGAPLPTHSQKTRMCAAPGQNGII